MTRSPLAAKAPHNLPEVFLAAETHARAIETWSPAMPANLFNIAVVGLAAGLSATPTILLRFRTQHLGLLRALLAHLTVISTEVATQRAVLALVFHFAPSPPEVLPVGPLLAALRHPSCATLASAALTQLLFVRPGLLQWEPQEIKNKKGKEKVKAKVEEEDLLAPPPEQTSAWWETHAAVAAMLTGLRLLVGTVLWPAPETPVQTQTTPNKPSTKVSPSPAVRAKLLVRLTQWVQAANTAGVARSSSPAVVWNWLLLLLSLQGISSHSKDTTTNNTNDTHNSNTNNMREEDALTQLARKALHAAGVAPASPPLAAATPATEAEPATTPTAAIDENETLVDTFSHPLGRSSNDPAEVAKQQAWLQWLLAEPRRVAGVQTVEALRARLAEVVPPVSMQFRGWRAALLTSLPGALLHLTKVLQEQGQSVQTSSEAEAAEADVWEFWLPALQEAISLSISTTSTSPLISFTNPVETLALGFEAAGGLRWVVERFSHFSLRTTPDARVLTLVQLLHAFWPGIAQLGETAEVLGENLALGLRTLAEAMPTSVLFASASAIEEEAAYVSSARVDLLNAWTPVLQLLARCAALAPAVLSVSIVADLATVLAQLEESMKSQRKRLREAERDGVRLDAAAKRQHQQQYEIEEATREGFREAGTTALVALTRVHPHAVSVVLDFEFLSDFFTPAEAETADADGSPAMGPEEVAQSTPLARTSLRVMAMLARVLPEAVGLEWIEVLRMGLLRVLAQEKAFNDDEKGKGVVEEEVKKEGDQSLIKQTEDTSIKQVDQTPGETQAELNSEALVEPSSARLATALFDCILASFMAVPDAPSYLFDDEDVGRALVQYLQRVPMVGAPKESTDPAAEATEAEGTVETTTRTTTAGAAVAITTTTTTAPLDVLSESEIKHLAQLYRITASVPEASLAAEIAACIPGLLRYPPISVRLLPACVATSKELLPAIAAFLEAQATQLSPRILVNVLLPLLARGDEAFGVELPIRLARATAHLPGTQDGIWDELLAQSHHGLWTWAQQPVGLAEQTIQDAAWALRCVEAWTREAVSVGSPCAAFMAAAPAAREQVLEYLDFLVFAPVFGFFDGLAQTALSSLLEDVDKVETPEEEEEGEEEEDEQSENSAREEEKQEEKKGETNENKTSAEVVGSHRPEMHIDPTPETNPNPNPSSAAVAPNALPLEAQTVAVVLARILARLLEAPNGALPQPPEHPEDLLCRVLNLANHLFFPIVRRDANRRDVRAECASTPLLTASTALNHTTTMKSTLGAVTQQRLREPEMRPARALAEAFYHAATAALGGLPAGLFNDPTPSAALPEWLGNFLERHAVRDRRRGRWSRRFWSVCLSRATIRRWLRARGLAKAETVVSPDMASRSLQATG